MKTEERASMKRKGDATTPSQAAAKSSKSNTANPQWGDKGKQYTASRAEANAAKAAYSTALARL